MIIDSTVRVNDGNGNTQLFAKNGPLMDLLLKGCAVPDPVHVTYNLGTKTVYKMNKDGSYVLDKNGKRIKLRDYATLTTVVNWATGEKTMVQNSEADGLILDKNGKPSIFSKECGFVFALAKRVLAGKITSNDGELEYSDSGFGTILNKIVKSAVDQQELEAKRKAEKALSAQRRLESEKRHLEKMNASEPSLRQCVKDLSDVVAALKAEVADVKTPISKKPTVKKALNKKSSKKVSK